MADSSFDIVSKVDRQEVDNALNQAGKELSTRFDFRGTDTTIAWKGDEVIEIVSSTEERAKAAVDVFKGQGEGAALGIEAQGLWDLRQAWRIGPRLSASLGNGNGSPTSGDGQIVMAGIRVHSGDVVFGVDSVFIRNGQDGDHGFANGVLAGVGIGGRSGKYGIAISAGAAALLGILAIVALSQVSTH